MKKFLVIAATLSLIACGGDSKPTAEEEKKANAERDTSIKAADDFLNDTTSTNTDTTKNK